MTAGREDQRKQSQRRAAGGENVNGKSANALHALLVAPIELDDLGRPAGQIPVAAEAAEARLVGARDDDVRADPVFAVTDHNIALLFAAYRRDGAIDIFFDVHDARLALRLVTDRHLADAEELPDQNRQQMRGA